MIEIDANGVNGNVFEITGSDITLQRLRMYGSGNGWANVYIHGSAQGIKIINNVIGDDDPAQGGCGQSPDSHSGIYIASTGSTSPVAWIHGNTIECHQGDPGAGIVVTGSDTSNVLIGENEAGEAGSEQQNLIRTNDGAGIRVLDSDNAVIGTRNSVKYNGEAGIAVTGDSSGINVHVQAVYGNGGLAIDLGNDGHTANDAGDGDSGPNTLLNYPVITSSSGSTITGTACVCNVHIYEAVGDPAAPGGGGVLVETVPADSGGNWNATLPDGLTRLDVTTMAVDFSLNSSEMAPRPQVFMPLIRRP